MNRVNRIFISYSHRGNGPEWKAWLLRHLGVFEQHHLLDVWQDGRIRVSSYWDDDITQAMSGARLAVVLLTPEALQSQYILEKEFPFLRERQHRDKLAVFPVVCEPCDWKAHDWLRATQAPNASNPISPLTEAEQDRIFRQLGTDIATELSRVALAEFPKSDQPPPADHIYLEGFPLTRGPGLREEKLIGREQELALLDLAFAQPHTAIVSLVAWGGVGKTMLVQHWLQRLQREGWFGAQRVYAWSFYSQGTKEDRQASEDTFLTHALAWFGVQCEPTLSPWDKGRLLADAVARERTLLILDGIEPLQYPPGPMGGQLRAPGVLSLLKHLARKAQKLSPSPAPAGEGQGEGDAGTLCLVTTREPLTDLADFQRREGSPWGSALRVNLGNLTDEAGAALVHHAGANRAGAAEIKPDDKELFAASRKVDGHALTLNLLGRFLARAHGGDIRRRDLVKFEEADREEQGGTTFKMLAAFENWFAKSGDFGARQLTVLRMLGLFDRPADAGCIGALRHPPVIAGLTKPLFLPKARFLGVVVGWQPLSGEDWNTVVSFLSDFGLVIIQGDMAAILIDCHPLIREHFAKQLREKYAPHWRAAHRRIYEHLKGSAEPSPATINDLQPLYQAVLHGCQASLYQDAAKVYRDRIQRGEAAYSTKVLGALGSDLSAIACFFDQPWRHVASGLSKSAQAWILNEAAFTLRGLGRLTDAADPAHSAFDWFHAKNWPDACVMAVNLSEIELTLGQVANAMSWAQRSLAILKQLGGPDWKTYDRAITTLANVLHQSGQSREAEECFRESEQQPQTPMLYSVRGFNYCDLILAKPEHAAWRFVLVPAEPDSSTGRQPDASLLGCARHAKSRATTTIQWAKERGRLLDIALDNLTTGRAELMLALLEKSEAFHSQSAIREAVEGFRRAGIHEHLSRALLAQTWLRFLQDDRDGARADLDEAWDIAERGPMRLHLADIHLYRARLFFREKPYPWKSPQADLAAADKLINDCGYHRRDEELADAKRAILGA